MADRLARSLLRGHTRKLGRSVLGAWQRSFGRVEPADNLAVFSAPRGGSTWLAEMLVGLGGYTMIWEPLHYDDVDAIAAGFEWPNYVSPADKDPRKLAYGRALLAGDLLARRVSVAEFRVAELLHLRGYVLKFVDGNLALNWLAANFPLRAVLLLRHPCAVVLSQCFHPAWAGVTTEHAKVPAQMGERYPHLKEIAGRLRSRHEVLAFVWAVQTWGVLREAATPLPYALVSYEELRQQPLAGLAHVLGQLGESASGLNQVDAARPSITTNTNSTLSEQGGRSQGWREAFKPHEIDEIMAVVRAVGLELYGESKEGPNWRTPGRGLEHVKPSWSLEP